MSGSLLKHAVKLTEDRLFDETVPSSMFKNKNGLNKVAHIINDMQFPSTVSAKVEIEGMQEVMNMTWTLDEMSTSDVHSGFRQVTFMYSWDRQTSKAVDTYVAEYQGKLEDDPETSNSDIDDLSDELISALAIETFYVVFDLADKTIFGSLKDYSKDY